MKKFVVAALDALAALELQPTFFKAYRTLGRVRLALGFYEDAVATFRSAVQASGGISDAEHASIVQELDQAEAALQRLAFMDHYALLGIARTATPSEVTKAYRKASMIYHPDKVCQRGSQHQYALTAANSPCCQQGGCSEHFKRVLNAYEVLSDPERRAIYG